MKYTVTPKVGEPFALEASDVIVAMADAEERLGTEDYSIQKTDATPAPLFGTLTDTGYASND